MKKLIFATMLFLGVAVTGFSQEKPKYEKRTPEERAQLMTDALDKKLSLSDKQKQEIYKVNLDRAKQMEQFRGQAKDQKKKDFAKSKAAFEASDNKINSILTTDQRKTYAELKAQRAAKAKSHKGEFKKDGRKKRNEA